MGVLLPLHMYACCQLEPWQKARDVLSMHGNLRIPKCVPCKEFIHDMNIKNKTSIF